MTPQQQISDIDNNSHMPAAQKEAAKAAIARQSQIKAQSTPSGSR